MTLRACLQITIVRFLQLFSHLLTPPLALLYLSMCFEAALKPAKKFIKNQAMGLCKHALRVALRLSFMDKSFFSLFYLSWQKLNITLSCLGWNNGRV